MSLIFDYNTFCIEIIILLLYISSVASVVLAPDKISAAKPVCYHQCLEMAAGATCNDSPAGDPVEC